MDGSATWHGVVNEDGSWSILARVTALDATGTEVRPEEGPCVEVADVATIGAKVWALGANKDNESGTEVAPAPTVSAAANVFDDLRTSGWPTGRDPHGYNFRLDLGPTYSANPNEWYLVEVKITTSGSTIWVKAKVKTRPVRT